MPAALLLAVPAPARAQVKIELAPSTGLERRGKAQLERLLATYDLRPWLFTRTVRIESHVIPHSHPVLTVNTHYLENDTAQVATFIHEQLHWFLVERGEARTPRWPRCDGCFRACRPSRPRGSGMRRVRISIFGEATARRTLQCWSLYTWVYRQVLERTNALRRVLRIHGLDLNRDEAAPGKPATSSGQRG